MGVIRKQSFWISLIIYVGFFIGFVTSLYVLPEALEVQEIGLYKIIIDISFFFAPFASIGIQLGLLKFYPKFKNKPEESSRFENTSFLILCFNLLCFLVMFFMCKDVVLNFFAKNASEVHQYFGVIVGIIVLLMFINYFDYYGRAKVKLIVPTIFKEVFIRFLTMIGLLLIIADVFYFQSFIYALFAFYAVYLMFLVSYLVYSGIVKINFSKGFISIPQIKQLLSYTMVMFLNVFYLVVLKVDGIMVGSILGLKSLGIFAIGFNITVIMEIPRRAVTLVGGSVLVQSMADKNFDNVAEIYRKTAFVQFVLGAIFFVGILINLESLYSIIPKGDILRGGTTVVILIALTKLIDMSFGVNGDILNLSNFYRWNIVLIILLAIFTVILNFLLIPILGINGAALATLISFFAYNVVRSYIIWHFYKLQPFTMSFVKVLLLATSVYLLNFLLPTISSPILDIIYRSIFTGALYFSVLIYFNWSSDITDLYQLILKKIKRN